MQIFIFCCSRGCFSGIWGTSIIIFPFQTLILLVHRSLKLYSLYLADCSLWAAMSGNTWWYWEFNEAFLKGALLNYCKCCIWITSHSRCHWWGVSRVEDLHNLRDVRRLSGVWMWARGRTLSRRDDRFTVVCHSHRRFIIFTCHFLKCKVIYHLKTCNLSSATDKCRNDMLSKGCTFFNEQRETPCDLSSWQNSSLWNVKSILVQCF